MKTAEEFVLELELYGDLEKTSAKMIAFAKMHVEAALEAAADNVELQDTPYYLGNDQYRKEVDKDSIREAYPLEKIR